MSRQRTIVVLCWVVAQTVKEPLLTRGTIQEAERSRAAEWTASPFHQDAEK